MENGACNINYFNFEFVFKYFLQILHAYAHQILNDRELPEKNSWNGAKMNNHIIFATIFNYNVRFAIWI